MDEDLDRSLTSVPGCWISVLHVHTPSMALWAVNYGNIRGTATARRDGASSVDRGGAHVKIYFQKEVDLMFYIDCPARRARIRIEQ